MPHTIVIFGASGDLTQRKLIPALYRLHAKGRLPELTRVVGVSRSVMTDDEWRSALAESTASHVGKRFDAETWRALAGRLFYVAGDVKRQEDFARLAARLDELEAGAEAVRVYYLSTAPALYAEAAEGLAAAGLAGEERGPRRIVIEKPFGVDLASARRLNERLHAVFAEGQVYRIDHYLGKETVQNLLVLRFANSIFEPIWNRNFIDHVQITVAEEVLVGRRGDYYDSAGILRDMFQNHLLQLLAITAMEAPPRYEAGLVRDEKVKVLRAVRLMDEREAAEMTVAGQYEGYLQEEGVAAGSSTATFAALRLLIDNWRWKGVPFYLRSGKAMSCRTTQIVIQFHEPPHLLFGGSRRIDANRLVVQVQPAEGIQLEFQTKVPDEDMRLITTPLDFRFAREFQNDLPDAYQRLLLDALSGDAGLFLRSDEVELSWGIIDPIIQAWDQNGAQRPLVYPRGHWGPENSTGWMRRQGREWYDVCPVLR